MISVGKKCEKTSIKVSAACMMVDLITFQKTKTTSWMTRVRKLEQTRAMETLRTGTNLKRMAPRLHLAGRNQTTDKTRLSAMVANTLRQRIPTEDSLPVGISRMKFTRSPGVSQFIGARKAGHLSKHQNSKRSTVDADSTIPMMTYGLIRNKHRISHKHSLARPMTEEPRTLLRQTGIDSRA